MNRIPEARVVAIGPAAAAAPHPATMILNWHQGAGRE
jgi:hypothetical protein